jgi:hypothetical protein
MTACISLIVFGSVRGSISADKLPSETALSQCLPSNVKLSDIVSANLITSYSDRRAPVFDRVTIEQKLKDLNARCHEGKLVDGDGKEIYFYRLTGCWGNPPIGYQNILNRQQDEINKLKEHYAVIEMTCNPSGLPIQ